MLKRLLNLFRRESEPEPKPDPEPIQMPARGEKWVLTDESPWPDRYPPVTILDVRDGWVRYYMGGFFPDNRMEVERFVRVYRLAGGPA